MNPIARRTLLLAAAASRNSWTAFAAAARSPGPTSSPKLSMLPEPVAAPPLPVCADPALDIAGFRVYESPAFYERPVL